MTDSDLAGQISQLEAEIEHLADVAERCRKIIVASRLAIVVGGLWLLGIALGVVPFDQLGFICSITAIIGGIVAFGSNTRTWQQTIDTLKAAQARRSELIDTIDLKLVTDGTRETD